MLEDKSYFIKDDSGEELLKVNYDFAPSEWAYGLKSAGDFEGVPFRPVRGTEEKLLAGPVVDGYLYFASDTGKIFLGKGYDLIPMGGGGVSVLYADGEVVDNNNETYALQKDSLLDETATPKEDDLIINKDGRFFKVTYYDIMGGTITCQLIAVSGSGGGGGGESGGPGGDSSQNITVVYHNSSMSFLKGDKFYIDLTATGPENVSSMYLEYTVYSAAGGTPKTNSMQITSGQRVSIEVGEYMRIGNNRVEISISGMGANNYFKKISGIRMVSMNVETDLDEFSNYAIYNSNFTYYVKYYTSNPATLKVFIDDNLVASKPVDVSTSSTGNKTSVNINPSNLNLDAGIHIISAYLEESGGFRSDSTEIDFIYHPAGSDDAVYIVLTSYPKEILSYEIPEVKFWVYDTSKGPGATNEITYSVNGIIGDTVKKEQIEGKEYGLSWLVTGLEANAMNSCTIYVGQNSERTFEIYVEKSDIFDPTESGAVLLLSADGRTNDTSLERRTQWQYTNQSGKTISTKFNDFNWENNGWAFDEDEGRTCLRISNGANIEIPIKLFQDYGSAGSSGYTIEFEFKPYNLYSYKSLSQITNIVYDENEEVVRVDRDYDMSLASITYSLGNEAASTGFGIGTQDTFFRMTTNDNVAAQYIENEVINVSIVLNTNNKQMLIYLNGILSGMAEYTDGTSPAIPSGVSAIKVNSEYADIDLYSVRMYNRALNSTEVAQNYIASKKDLELYRQNQLGAVDNTVSYEDLVKYNEENPENCTIPYIVFKTKSSPDILPYNKENNDIMVDILFKNVAADFKLANSAKSASDIEEYLKHAPSFEAKDVRLNVQGTSSQKYPRKNFKGKMLKEDTSTITCINTAIPADKKEMSKLYLNPDAGEKTFTWKADYMDSSGKHNTGFTSFVKEVYNKHPLDYYFGTKGDYYKNYRTTIFGFPVLAFHEKSNGDVEFIGRYNFNLDKSCETSIGMKIDDVHPVLGEKIKKIAECWEFGNNKGGLCSFRYKNNFFEDIGNLIEDLEPRYHNDGDAIENAFDEKDESGENSISKEAAEAIIRDKYQHLAKVMDWVNSTYCGFNLLDPADQILAKKMMGLSADAADITEDYIHPTATITEKVLDTEGKETGETITRAKTYKDFKNERKKKFKDEFALHFNEEYCLVYYVLTEVLVLFDSRGKNMMLGSWGPIKEGGEYIWFPLFYDVDTQLGINNSGYPTMNYNVEPTPEGKYSTNNSLFWRSFGEAFSSQIRGKYRDIRNGNFTQADINAYYDFDEEKSIAMKGILPITVINADAHYKYILPSYPVSNGGGYVSGIDSSGHPTYKTTKSYFYCVQGTRDLYRAQFLRNRFNYCDSMWLAGGYSGGLGDTDSLRIRVASVTGAESSLNSNFTINIMPVLDQYIIAHPDEINPETLYDRRVKAAAGQIVPFDLNQFVEGGNAADQIMIIPGGSFIQKLGDLSLLYLSELEFPRNINEILLGNQNPKYDNNTGMSNIIFTQINNDKPLLKEYDITNLSILASNINLEGSPKLEIFKALGTSIPSVVFSGSPDISQVYLPKTIQALKLNKASNLNKIIYDLTTGDEQGLYIEDLIHSDDSNNSVVSINNINIVGDNFSQYEYEFLNKIIAAKENMQDKVLKTPYTGFLGVHLEDVLWTPYNKLGEGAIYNANKADSYRYANNDFTFSSYVFTNEDDWNLHIANERIYEYVGSEIELATDLSLLDKLIENSFFVENYEKDLDAEKMKKPYISGEFYVNNTKEISETDITNYYNVHFPDLKIKVANIKPSNRIRFVQRHEPTMGKTEKELSVLRFDDGDYNPTKIIVPNIPIINHYDSTDIWEYEEKGQIREVKASDLASIVNNFASKNEFTFYTKYVRTSYKIIFHYDDSEKPYEKYVLYNDYIGTPTEIFPYKDDSSLPLKETYKFEYYVAKEGSSTKADLENIKATRNEMEFWAYFKPVSVYENVIDPKYIRVEGGVIRRYDTYIDPDNIYRYQTFFKGKITLPSGATSISGSLFQQCRNITHIFIKDIENSNISSIGYYAFESCTKLEYIEVPASLTTINSNAFLNCSKLKYFGLPLDKEMSKEDFEKNYSTRKILIPSSVVNFGESALDVGKSLAFSSLGNIGEMHFGSSITDLWQVSSMDTVASDIDGVGTKIESLIIFRDPVTQHFVDEWIDSSGFNSTVQLQP